MKHGNSAVVNLTPFLRKRSPLSVGLRHLGRWQTHSCLQPQQSAPRHPQIGERKQRVQLRRVLGQSQVAHLHVAELALDDPKRVFHLGPDAGLDVFKSVEHRAHRTVLVQRPAFAWVQTICQLVSTPAEISSVGVFIRR